MSGAKKHMERSHRSYRQKVATVGRHAQKAIIYTEARKERKTIFQRLANMFHRKSA